MSGEGVDAAMDEAMVKPREVEDFMDMKDGVSIKAGWLPIMSSLTPIVGDRKCGMHWRNIAVNHTDIKLDIMAEIMNNGLGDPAKFKVENNSMKTLSKLDNDLMHLVVFKQVNDN